MSTNNLEFADADTRQRLYSAQRRFHRTIIGFFVVSMIINLVFVVFVTIFELEAKNGRQTISDCIQPSGACANAAIQASINRGTAIVFCQKSLPPTTTRDDVLKCIVENSGGR